MRRRDLSAARAVARVERAARFLHGPFAAAHMLERADERPHLMMQKGGGAREDFNLIADAAHIETLERANGRPRLAFAGAIGREVEFPDEPLRRVMHGLGVERSFDVPDASPSQRRRRAPIADEIAVMAHLGGEARFKGVRDGLSGKHGDWVGPKMGIERVTQPIDPPVPRQIDMRHLPQRMHARIRAPCPMHDARIAVDRRDSFL